MKSIILSLALLLNSVSYSQTLSCKVSDLTVERIEYYRTAIPYIKTSYVLNSIELLLREDPCIHLYLSPYLQSGLALKIVNSKEKYIKNTIFLALELAQSQK